MKQKKKKKKKQKNRHAMLLLGLYDINQIEMFTASHTKMILLVECNHNNQGGIFTSTPC